MKIALMVIWCLAIANFGYQWVTDQNWLVALERTYFQTVACIAMAFSDYLLRRIVGAP